MINKAESTKEDLRTCKNPDCNQPLFYKEDSLGRAIRRDFCSDSCRHVYFRKYQRPDYYKYYMRKRRAEQKEQEQEVG